jgi:hypothetical protein
LQVYERQGEYKGRAATSRATCTTEELLNERIQRVTRADQETQGGKKYSSGITDERESR